jgi:PKD repeat protein
MLKIYILKLLICFNLLLGVIPEIKAQTKNRHQKQLNHLFKNRGELYFRFILKDKKDLPELTRAISIDHKKGDTLFAFANRRGMQRFFELGYSRYRVLETPAEEFRRLERKENRAKKKLSPLSTQAFDSYLTYPGYEQAMLDFQANYPQICRLVNLGTLPSGRKILALKISDSVDITQNEPRFLYTSTMHGDETAGYPMMLKLADTLLRGYGSDTELTRLVNEMEIWINPLANPDGTYRGGNQTVSGATRFNAANIDLNRNYPDPQDGAHPDGEAYQPETKIFMKLADSLRFVMAANFHGGAEVWNFPWDTWQRRHPDENWWTAEGVKFAGSARSNSATFFNQNYGYPNLPGVCQGFEWYEVNGGRQDYMNWFHHCREVTLELSDTKLIPNSQIPVHWQWLRRSIIDYMKASLRGIRGRISDACTGLPVLAQVEVRNHDKDNSHIFSGMENGNYHRPIFIGSYSLVVSAAGYQTDSLPAISVGEGDAALRNLVLQPLEPVANFNVAIRDLCGSEVIFNDRSGSASQWLWDFGDGNTSSEKNPQHSYEQEGIYTVKLVVSNCAGADTVLRQVNIIRPSAPLVRGDTSICGAVVHQLHAFSGNPVLWYSSASSVLPLDSSQVFLTPVLDSTQIYYVRSTKLLNLPDAGPADNQFGGGSFFTGNTYHYLNFDAHSAFRLKSVRVYANTAGNRSIQLRNAQGQVIRSKTVQIPQGDSRVNLGFDVPQGEGFQLGLAGGASNNLFRNNSGAAYPYEVDGILSITGNSAGNPAFYYYFYDWEISAACQSGAVPVQALVLNAPRPRISISVSQDTVCEDNVISFEAQFSNTLNPQFFWFNGSQPLGSQLSTATVFLPPGNHSITCRLLSADTCAVNNPVTSLPKQVVILARPPAPVIVQNGSWLVSNSGPVSWFVSGQPIGNSPSDSIFISESGLYSAIVLGSNGCASPSSQPLDITSIPGTENLDLRMYANGEKLMVENRTGKLQSLEILDAAGRCLRYFKADSGTSSFILTALPAGMLLVRNRESGMMMKVMR